MPKALAKAQLNIMEQADCFSENIFWETYEWK